MSPVLTLQKRMMQVGRVRLGEKGPRGEPRKLSTFRFTSADRTLLDEIAASYGGDVTEWTGAPDEGYFQVTTEAKQLDVILLPRYSEIDGSPSTTYSQWYEQWSAGGCKRRCDGITEQLSGKPCLCDPDKRTCQITTRVSFMLPGQRVGLWRLDTKGYYAAVEAPAMLDFLQHAAEGELLPAVLRIEHRTVKREVDGKTATLKFIVPVFDFPGANVPELPQGSVPLSLNPPTTVRQRPELPSGTPPPEGNGFDHDRAPEFGERPVLEPGVVPLTKSEFDTLNEVDGITKDQIREAGKRLFPGKTPSRLTDSERGHLRKELIA